MRLLAANHSQHPPHSARPPGLVLPHVEVGASRVKRPRAVGCTPSISSPTTRRGDVVQLSVAAPFKTDALPLLDKFWTLGLLSNTAAWRGQTLGRHRLRNPNAVPLSVGRRF